MDAQVDHHLGDSISYKRDGTLIERSAGVLTIPGFLELLADDGGMSGISPGRSRWQLKVRKSYLPGGVAKASDVITAAKLGGTNYRPGPNSITDDGSYIIMDLQKAP